VIESYVGYFFFLLVLVLLPLSCSVLFCLIVVFFSSPVLAVCSESDLILMCGASDLVVL
jgi:hypothetical protein